MDEDIIRIDADFRYEGAMEKTLKHVQGSIQRGRCIVLCGRSGCGKSTILRCMNHLIPDFYEGEFNGYCYLNGKDVMHMEIGEVGQSVSSVFQDPRSQFFTLNSTTEVAFGLENAGVEHSAMVKRVDKTFNDMKVERLKDRNVFELSSGERQLVAVLSSKAMDSDVVLLDEPTANLDYVAIENLKKLLLKIKEKGKTIILNEHRLYYLKGIADEYWYISEGTIVKKYNASELEAFSNEQLLEMNMRCFDLSGLKNTALKQIEVKANNTIEMDNIFYKYAGMKGNVLKGASCIAKTGEAIGIVGANGGGKTTLGKIISGLLKPVGGTIYFNGKKENHKSLQNKSLFIMQEAEFQFFTNSVKNELMYGKKYSKEMEDTIELLLKEYDMWELRDRHPFSLSGGQMQKLVLMLAYLSEKPVVVLDEPTAGLDMKSLISSVKLIEKMRSNKIVFIITHDLEFISKACTSCISVLGGTISKRYDMSVSEDFSCLKDFISSEKETIKKSKKDIKIDTKHVDARVKILFSLLAMVSSFVADIPVIIMLFVAFSLIAFYEKRKKVTLLCGIPFVIIMILDFLVNSNAIGFIVNLIPRFLLMGIIGDAVIGTDGGQRTIATLRMMHVPEKLILVISVLCRFLPVLSNDLRILSQSIKTRGLFLTLKDKIKAAPEYLEILIVPLIYRVIRISETLSASAETRGIELKNKRVSYVTIRFCKADFILGILCAVLVTIGFIM